MTTAATFKSRTAHDVQHSLRMSRGTSSPASTSRSPAARPGWGWRSSASSSLAAPAWPSSPAPATPSTASPPSTRPRTASSATCRATEDIYPIAVQIVAALGRLDVLVNNASDLGPSPLALLADTACEDFERALATNVLGPFRLTKALLGSLAPSAREALRRRRDQHLERRRDPRLPRLGRVRRQQGRPASPESDLAGGARRRRHRRAVVRSRRHGHADARGGRPRRGPIGAEAPGGRGARAGRRDWQGARRARGRRPAPAEARR